MTLEEKQQEMQQRWRTKEERLPEEFKYKLTSSERRVFSLLLSEGHADIIRNGWPDFGVVVNGKLVGIEVKTSKHDCPSPEQQHAHKLLRKAGIPVLVIHDNGYLCSIIRQLRKTL
jgi:hypothetical protein